MDTLPAPPKADALQFALCHSFGAVAGAESDRLFSILITKVRMSNFVPDAVGVDGLISFWDFQEPPGTARIARGQYAYVLREAAGPINRVSGGVFGPYAAELRRGEYFVIPRAECPALDLHGTGAQLTVVARLQRHRKSEVECEAVAGIWNETYAKRQYCLFLDLRIHQGGDNVCGHVSATGGPTNGYPWCMDAAIDGNYLTYFDWHCVAFTYDGYYARAWLDGRSQSRVGFNPYAFPHGVYDAGPEGADFTVGAVHRVGEVGNWFVGWLGGLAVYRRALAVNELIALTAFLPSPPKASPTKPATLV